MTLSRFAAELGRKGGQARAARLPAERRREIAAQGAAARAASLEAARRIMVNFRYRELVLAFAPPAPKVKRVGSCPGPLPGLDGDDR